MNDQFFYFRFTKPILKPILKPTLKPILKPILLRLVFSLLLLFSFNLTTAYCSSPKGSISIACTHAQTCNLLSQMISENNLNQKIQVKKILKMSGDPHHFEPTTNDIKFLLQENFLVLPPLLLHPWLKKVEEKRKVTANLQTLETVIPQEVLKNYTTQNSQALAHFWLYPDVLCPVKKSLQERLSTLLKKIDPTISLKNNSCEDDIKKLKNDWKTIQEKNTSSLFILTHDALKPLLEKYGLKVVSLRGSGHHEDVNAHDLKTMMEKLKQEKKVIWLIEEDHDHKTIWTKAKHRSGDKIIHLNTEGHFPQYYLEVLTNITQELKK